MGSVMPTAANRKLYNGGSEWQDDFGDLPDLQQTFYRMYDAALGRFVAVDPMPEASESLGTYHYAMDNPVMFNDPMGDVSQRLWDKVLDFAQNGTSRMEADGMHYYGDEESTLERENGGYGYYVAAGQKFFNDDHTGVVDSKGFYMGNVYTIWKFIAIDTKIARITDKKEQEGYWSRLDWKGIGDATVGVLAGAGEIIGGTATEVGSEGASSALSIPLIVDGYYRVVANTGRLTAYFSQNKELGDAMPGNIGAMVGRLYDGSTGKSLYEVGNGQAILGSVNDLLLIISPAGNAGAYKEVLTNPTFWNTFSVGTSFYGGSVGLKNDLQSIKNK